MIIVYELRNRFEDVFNCFFFLQTNMLIIMPSSKCASWIIRGIARSKVQSANGIRIGIENNVINDNNNDENKTSV